MSNISIRETSVSEIASNSNTGAVLSEYAAESSITGLPPPKADFNMYSRLEAAGVFKAFGAFLENELIGFICVLVTSLPHYSEKVATIESFFVVDKFRKLGAGGKLLVMAKIAAKNAGAVGLLISAPVGGKLVKVLECGKGFTETNRVFFTRLV